MQRNSILIPALIHVPIFDRGTFRRNGNSPVMRNQNLFRVETVGGYKFLPQNSLTNGCKATMLPSKIQDKRNFVLLQDLTLRYHYILIVREP
jgi:hypothetical protein